MPIGTTGGISVYAKDAAQYQIDNGSTRKSVTSQRITLDDGAITLWLLKATASPVTVAVTAQKTETSQAIQSFVNAWNASFDFLTTNPGELTTPLASQLNSAAAGVASSLGAIGIERGTNGQFTVDTTKLASAIDNNFDHLRLLLSAMANSRPAPGRGLSHGAREIRHASAKPGGRRGLALDRLLGHARGLLIEYPRLDYTQLLALIVDHALAVDVRRAARRKRRAGPSVVPARRSDETSCRRCAQRAAPCGAADIDGSLLDVDGGAGRRRGGATAGRADACSTPASQRPAEPAPTPDPARLFRRAPERRRPAFGSQSMRSWSEIHHRR